VNRIDVVLLMFLALYAFLGYRRGFLAAALDWLGLAAAVAAALWQSPALGEWLAARYSMPGAVARLAAFLGLLLGIRFLWGLVVMLIWRRIPRALRNSTVNRVAGVAPGLVQGGLIAALALVMLAALPVPLVPRSEIAASPMGSTLLRWGVTVQAAVQDWMGGTLRDLITYRPPPIKSGERVELPFRTTEAVPDPDTEAAMLKLLNTERRQRGLKPLRMDDELRQVARSHSKDMLARGYFAHESPDGRGPFDRLKAAGIQYRAAGENLALAPDVTTAHRGLMESPGHRANILRREFGRVGIGAMRASPYGMMFTQVFRD
jgi:uncharacterized protein YkwD/uncharacterized membrane protein required for colicin V production